MRPAQIAVLYPCLRCAMPVPATRRRCKLHLATQATNAEVTDEENRCPTLKFSLQVSEAEHVTTKATRIVNVDYYLQERLTVK